MTKTSTLCVRKKIALALICTWTAAAWAATAELRAEETGVLAASVRSFVDRQELAGAVMLVANREKVLDVEAAGWADIAGNKPMRTDSMFWIASQSKPITGAALMLLVDEGKVRLDDPVEKYLPEFGGQMFVAEKDGDHKLLRKPRHPITESAAHFHGAHQRDALQHRH